MEDVGGVGALYRLFQGFDVDGSGFFILRRVDGRLGGQVMSGVIGGCLRFVFFDGGCIYPSRGEGRVCSHGRWDAGNFTSYGGLVWVSGAVLGRHRCEGLFRLGDDVSSGLFDTGHRSFRWAGD